MEYNERKDISLKGIEFEIATVMKIENNFAPIGLIDKYNTGASVIDFENFGKIKKITASGKGKFAFYSNKKPKTIAVNTKEVDFKFENCVAVFEIKDDKESEIVVSF